MQGHTDNRLRGNRDNEEIGAELNLLIISPVRVSHKSSLCSAMTLKTSSANILNPDFATATTVTGKRVSAVAGASLGDPGTDRAEVARPRTQGEER